MDSTVKVAAGHLHGTQVDGVHAFLGVPFAAPPVGRHRLRPPQPVEPWSGVREATEIGPAPPQVAPPEGGGSGWDTEAIGDDCLTLNVWTPDPGAAGLPVMMWVQGGMFEFGATAAYDGRHFARDGVVCVVINWRVGADGFLYLDDGVANLGLLDQVAALEWVRDNIAAFGGDPDNVTVFGESAGAMSIGVMLAMPAARGLFRRAVLQSGAAHQALSAETAARVGRSLVDRLGVPPRRDAIAALPVERLLQAQAELKAELVAHPDPDRWGGDVVASMLPWQPVIDGRTLPGTPIELIAGGSAAQVDVLAGTNTDEWRLFLAITGEIARITEEHLTGPVGLHGFRTLAAYGLPVEKGLAAYRAHHPGAAPGELLAAVQTDWWTRVPAIRLAEAHVNQQSGTYMYEFAWPAPGLGAVHGLEIPFVFDTLGADAPLFGPLVGDTAPQGLADTMHRAWISFATTGDPGWPRYGPDRRATMRFDTDPLVVDDPRAWERDLWHGIR
ncbi:carboxylesterase/lipase family protein [Knoellia sp. p5-6-4]|uniref:carboxylesterase/lipase family protein n=1 Tax=unclassified Knoellia TaxID=2618719 RepID=UPI0023DAC7AF|nr:carboxylesterase/lipase family protein [Knoellia sp. p5-6-4]MDF2145982.1 carboxylesterase/lipase family protein [Knoellia sp. p5-6-4]